MKKKEEKGKSAAMLKPHHLPYLALYLVLCHNRLKFKNIVVSLQTNP